jgi:phosphoserine aminotransferase
MKRVFNFNPGPATLPVSVLEEAARGVVEIGGSGMSILEVSHRGPEYETVHFEAQKRMLSLMGLSTDQYTVLFLGGGASLQFAMLPMNTLKPGESADYVHTGEWSSKAVKEAKFFGKPNVVASSEAAKFASLPHEMKPTPEARYFHLTTNNTIEGTQFWRIPDTGATPLVADMSSDMLGRNLDFSKFSLIYAGAQKNLGPAGVTAVVIKKSFLEQMREDIPSILSYKAHDKAQSLYNTPPAYGVYVLGLVLKWIESQGGVAGVEARNRKKAGAIYQALDERPDVYDPAVTVKEHRSLMNITFRLRDAAREKEFLTGAEKLGLIGLKGHRSVGGFRASIYNAFPAEGAEVLASYIRKF